MKTVMLVNLTELKSEPGSLLEDNWVSISVFVRLGRASVVLGKPQVLYMLIDTHKPQSCVVPCGCKGVIAMHP